MVMAAKTAKENMGSSNHMENLDDVKVEAGENYVAEQREQMRLLNARIVRKWSWVLNSFYITYTCLEWLVLCWKVFPAHIYVTVLCLLWGVCAMCSGLVHNMAGLIACRVGLGVLEAGFGAGVPYYLSLCYRRHELGTRVSILLGSSPIANCIAGAIAYGISQIRSHMEPWRVIFLIEGSPSIVIAPIVWFVLMDSPSTAKFFTNEERTFAVERMETRDTTRKSSLSRAQLFAGLTDYKNYCHACLHFCCNYSFAGLSNFLPTIVHEMGYDSVQAQGLTAPPYFGAFLSSILVAWLSDRYGSRGWILAISASVATVGYALLATQTGTAVRYVAIWLTSCGVFPALAINMTWMLNNNAGDTKKGIGMSLLAIIGQCSSFLASFMYPNSAAPYFIKGTAIGCGLTGIIVPVGLVLHFSYAAENRRRDREFGPVPQSDGPIDVSAVGDKHNHFRLLT
ncbi:major facilitator superfamily domain-containing protein [Aspergillus tamarii]|uniref:Major facilitator superfamily domain-containing protein n=1 Tax=Aspergillus tamarii TaxID=41984 RepID=A0A5N6VC11_ASPTM|nr:major facilitator superfamily domain-containing protein [Aspergillus tamarii]